MPPISPQTRRDGAGCQCRTGPAPALARLGVTAAVGIKAAKAIGGNSPLAIGKAIIESAENLAFKATRSLWQIDSMLLDPLPPLVPIPLELYRSSQK